MTGLEYGVNARLSRACFGIFNQKIGSVPANGDQSGREVGWREERPTIGPCTMCSRLEAHGNGISIILRQRNGKKAPKVAE